MLAATPISVPVVTYTSVPSTIAPKNLAGNQNTQDLRWRYVLKEQVQATSELDTLLMWVRLVEAKFESEFRLSRDSVYCFERYIRFFVKYSNSVDIAINSDGLIDLSWQKSARKTLIITMMPNMELAYGAFNEGEKANGVVTLQEMELVYGKAPKLLRLLNEIA